jgi:hypothetical protein
VSGTELCTFHALSKATENVSNNFDKPSTCSISTFAPDGQNKHFFKHNKILIKDTY